VEGNATHTLGIVKHESLRVPDLFPCFLLYINPFQSNFSANRILPRSYLFTSFIPAVFLQAQPREYNAQSPVHIRETERAQPALSVGQSLYYMRKSIGQAPTVERAKQKRVGCLPTSERNRKIIMSDEVWRRIGKG